MPTAYFVVRATVADPAKRARVSTRGIRTQHLPDATKAFGITKARRFWSASDPSLHMATYEFPIWRRWSAAPAPTP